MKTTFIELENEELHLRSGLSIMLQILNLSMRSKKTGIPPFLPSEILPSPYSLQKILRPPPPRKRILSPPLPCSIHCNPFRYKRCRETDRK